MDHEGAVVPDELEVLQACLGAHVHSLIELGCGRARLARQWMVQAPGRSYLGLDLDERAMARNAQEPVQGMRFELASATQVPADADTFDAAMMLKSLHHVPVPEMDEALQEVWRVLKPGGLLYVSEPVYAGALNEIVRLYNDEGVVRAAAQAALDRLPRQGKWSEGEAVRFTQPVHFADFAAFEKRMLQPTFMELDIDEGLLVRIAQAFAAHCDDDGADFTRPMLVRVFEKLQER